MWENDMHCSGVSRLIGGEPPWPETATQPYPPQSIPEVFKEVLHGSIAVVENSKRRIPYPSF